MPEAVLPGGSADSLGSAPEPFACMRSGLNHGIKALLLQVAEAMLPYVTSHFGNPSSIHTYGRHVSDMGAGRI